MPLGGGFALVSSPGRYLPVRTRRALPTPILSAPAISASASSPTITASLPSHPMLASAALKKSGAGLPSTRSLHAECIFQRSYEGAGVQAELAIRVLEAAIAREREEFGPCEELAEHCVERRIGKAVRRVAERHSFTLRAAEPGKVLGQSGMDQEMRRKLPRRKPRPCCLSRREQLFIGNGDAHAVKAREKRAPRHARRVGEKAQAQARLTQARDGSDGAWQRLLALINDAGKIEQNSAYH
jgi:hypothetical protein